MKSRASRLRAIRSAVLLASLGLSSATSAQPADVTIDVNATASGAPLNPIWSYFGYDEANYTTTTEGKELLHTLAQINAAPTYVRTHFLFNTGDGTPALKWGSTNLYTEDSDGNAVYSFDIIDAIMDAKVEAGVLPLVELGFMPQALSTQPDPYRPSATNTLDGGGFYPPKDYKKWEDMVRTWAEHVAERYPNAEADWQWELWNEPDIGYWQGTFEEFAQLYDHTEAALHEVFPDATLGGPAVAIPLRGFLADFLEHCEAGTNAVSGETGTRLDLVSFHAKGGVSLVEREVLMNLGNQLKLHQDGFGLVAASAFADKPIVITEADPDGCAACPASEAPHFRYRTSPAYGAYVAAMMKRTLDLADTMDVNLRGVLTWAFTFPGSDYFEGYRALATNGIHLPVLNVFKLLGRMQGKRLPVSSTGAMPLETLIEDGVRAQPDIDALATRDGERIQILVWHYHDLLTEADAANVNLELELPENFGRSAQLSHLRVDETHGNAFMVWLDQGRPEAPSSEQLNELEQAMQPVELAKADPATIADGKLTLSFELPRFGVSLLTLTPGNEAEPPEESAPAPGCDCRLTSVAGETVSPLLAFLLGLALLRRRGTPQA